jgi:nitrogen PTS system EIIA component
MDIGDLLTPEGIFPALEAPTKKDALHGLAERAGVLTGLSSRDIFDTLLQRERLGSTGLGSGIAIPHVRIKGLKGIFTVFARASAPIDFESHDGEPVDLIFLLLAPDHAGGDHLKALARISRLVREPSVLKGLREASDASAIHRILSMPPTSHAA